LLTAGLSCLLIGVARAAAWGWTGLPVLALLGAGLLTCAAWIAVGLRSGNPLTGMAMMRVRGVRTVNLAAFLAGGGLCAWFLLLPQFARLPGEHRLRLWRLGGGGRAGRAPVQLAQRTHRRGGHRAATALTRGRRDSPRPRDSVDPWLPAGQRSGVSAVAGSGRRAAALTGWRCRPQRLCSWRHCHRWLRA